MDTKSYGKLIEGLRSRLREFRSANGANVTITFALATVPMVGFVGAPRKGPRAPGPPPLKVDLGPGSSACQAARSQGRPQREPRKLPGASRRSIPSFEGDGKQGRRTGVSKNTGDDACLALAV